MQNKNSAIKDIGPVKWGPMFNIIMKFAQIKDG